MRRMSNSIHFPGTISFNKPGPIIQAPRLFVQYTRDRRATMRFADDTHVVDDPRREERLLWDGIL